MFFSHFIALAMATSVALVSAGPAPTTDTCNVNAAIYSLTGFNGRRKELPIDAECNPLADPFVTSVGSVKLPRGALCQFYSDENCETSTSIVSSRSVPDAFKHDGRQTKSIKCLYIPEEGEKPAEQGDSESG
ncbi:hypothetical protein H112_04128 [Trichophyton rubrum D6]|uniref:Uncharacterized protein n=5 Tax=Trichophyton TaxID=5550 RepID=A0A178F269_TRIRU|nr:uncharacterized protein TERG_03908 [Trichophyton rubrum CBS 118892]EZF23141.1 hypothetical protein H100_04133 [Trichophyton rubrum MR850]EZF42186.1 hypothetical protein H102_04121 [Trichophyton rubrum CBS 100081]EZF52836.1 hypothetical protein H103_04133 [Trichophyton rubrum CBS 288.86]EZF63435.1 hypothetical protein H104_04118 [Trichophyton rubrum CBS 289.86]EZF74024.1 hypothetical protein H105_04151 [Trichophyton soudanense CBS 452.61]EZF84747.1 hypothetical protein H110_04126 [Trichophy